MATKRLHSMIFPGLADSYTVPQQTTELSDFDNFVKAGLAIISNGNTHLDIPADMYVYVYNHNTLDNGLYQNISGATIPVGATLTTSNVSQVTGGGLNVLKNTLNHVEDGLAIPQTGNTCSRDSGIPVGAFIFLQGHSTLADGIYKNNSGSIIAKNTTFTSSNLTRCYQETGALNKLNSSTVANTDGINNLNIQIQFFNIGNTSSTSHANIDKLGYRFFKTWVMDNYLANTSVWAIGFQTVLNEGIGSNHAEMQILLFGETRPKIASRIYINGAWGSWTVS